MTDDWGDAWGLTAQPAPMTSTVVVALVTFGVSIAVVGATAAGIVGTVRHLLRRGAR